MARRLDRGRFTAATEHPLTCRRCGRTDALDVGAHPTPDMSTWCLEQAAEIPPRAEAEAWYGAPLPSPADAEAHWHSIGGKGYLASEAEWPELAEPEPEPEPKVMLTVEPEPKSSGAFF